MDYSCQKLPEINSARLQALHTNNDGCEQAGPSKAHRFTSLNRNDSGFEEVCRPRYVTLSHTRSLITGAASGDPTVSTIRSNSRFSEDIPPQERAESRTTHKPSQQGSGQNLGVDVSINFQRPVSITSSSTRRSSTSTKSLPSSSTSSRQSSASSNKKSLGTAALRSAGAGYEGACNQDALALDPQCGGLFMPFNNPPNPPPAPSSRLTSPMPTSATTDPLSFPHKPKWTASLASVEETSPETLRDNQYEFENYVPASHIDWTQQSTREREYRKIDQSSRGLRGLWRRLTPRWCHGKGGHLHFFREGDKEDDGSVRRYRINIAGKGDKPKWGIGEEEHEEEQEQEQEQPETTVPESPSSIKHRLRRCLSFSVENRTRMRVMKLLKGKGKEKRRRKWKRVRNPKRRRKSKGNQRRSKRETDEIVWYHIPARSHVERPGGVVLGNRLLVVITVSLMIIINNDEWMNEIPPLLGCLRLSDKLIINNHTIIAFSLTQIFYTFMCSFINEWIYR